MNPAYLSPHVAAELCIKVCKRFIEKKDIWIVDEGAGDGDALLLTAGKARRRRVSLELVLKAYKLHDISDLLLDDVVWDFSNSKSVCDVFEYRHVRIEGKALEHHSNVSLERRNR